MSNLTIFKFFLCSFINIQEYIKSICKHMILKITCKAFHSLKKWNDISSTYTMKWSNQNMRVLDFLWEYVILLMFQIQIALLRNQRRHYYQSLLWGIRVYVSKGFLTLFPSFLLLICLLQCKKKHNALLN